jgi:type I restriction enzyme S subunit
MSWNEVKLKDVINKPISGEWGNGAGNIKVIRSTNFTNDGKLDLTDVVSRDIELRKVDQKQLFYGDIIIEKSGGSPNQPVGRVVYFDLNEGVYLCNNFTSVLRSSSAVYSRYLFWFLFNSHLSGNTLKYQNKTTGIINLQLERYIEELRIPLPPLPIQRRIAEILDAADALRRKDQELLNKYDELAQAIFIDMFGDPVKNEKGWEVKRLGEIFDIQLGKMLSSNLNKGTHSKKYLRNINVQWGIVNTDDLKEMLFTDKELDKFRVEKGDILVCEGGAVGRTAVYRNSEEIYFQKSLHRLRPKETGTINATYFEGFMRSAVSNGLLDKIVVSATIAHLTLEKLKELEIIHPDFETQNRYAKAIEIIRHSKNSECANILFENLLCHLVNRNMSKE